AGHANRQIRAGDQSQNGESAEPRRPTVSARHRRRGDRVRRRTFIAAVGAATFAVPRFGRAQSTAMPVIGFLHSASPGLYAWPLQVFRTGLGETGYIEGQNVAIEYRWAENQYNRLPAMAADLVQRQVSVIAAATTPAALAAKAATTTIPIVFETGS